MSLSLMLPIKSITTKKPYVKKVHFSVLSSEEIRKQSVSEVKNTSIYVAGEPRSDAINNHKMGTCDKRMLCGTCGCGVEVSEQIMSYDCDPYS